jgi:hypothetical protein
LFVTLRQSIVPVFKNAAKSAGPVRFVQAADALPPSPAINASAELAERIARLCDRDFLNIVLNPPVHR